MLFISNSERLSGVGILPTFKDNHTGNVLKQIVKVYIHDFFWSLFTACFIQYKSQSPFYYEQASYFVFRAFCLFYPRRVVFFQPFCRFLELFHYQ